MSLPINLLKYAGYWDVARTYYEYDSVISPIDNAYYCCVVERLVGGPDPSGQPSAVWIPYPTTGPLPPAPPFPPAYGSFSSQATQNIATAPTKTLLYYTDDDIHAVGMSSAITSPYLTVVNAGTYKVLSSVQFDKTGGGNAPVEMWIELNDVAVPNSATKLNLNQNQESVMTIEWFVDCIAGQRISIVAYDPTSSADFRALAVPSTLPLAPCPAIPSIITTVLRIA